MKKLLFSLFISINGFALLAQVDYKEEEVKHDIQTFRNATVSFGLDTVLTYNDIDGKLVTKRIFMPVGTGVVFYFNYQNIMIPCVVTVKHIFKDSIDNWFPKKLRIRFSQYDSLPIDKYFGDEYQLYGDLNLPAWFEHSDSTVDLAGILLNPTSEATRTIKNVITYTLISKDQEYFEGKEIFVLGYPGAVGVDLLSKAVLRKGIISWVPTDKEKPGKKILIDCNIFPGNSGGPVFSISGNAGAILSDTILKTSKFFGIVSQRRFSDNYITLNGKKVTDTTGAPFLTYESMGIGVIITSNKVRELLNQMQMGFTKWANEEEKKFNRKIK